jgi:hypothetical protein
LLSVVIVARSRTLAVRPAVMPLLSHLNLGIWPVKTRPPDARVMTARQ